MAENLFNLLWILLLLGVGVVIFFIMRSDTSEALLSPDSRAAERVIDVNPVVTISLNRVAWRNLWRKKTRTWLLIASLALLGSLISGSYFFIQSIDQSLESAGGRLGADLMVIPQGAKAQFKDILISGEPSQFYMNESIARQVEALPGVKEVSPQLYLKTYSGDCCGVVGDYPVVGFLPEKDFTIKPWLINLKGFTGKSMIVGRKAAGYNAFHEANVEVMEDRIDLLGEQFYVKGILYPTGTGTDSTIFIHLKTAQRLAQENPHLDLKPGQISSLMIKTEAGTSLKELKMAIKSLGRVEVIEGNELIGGIRAKVRPLKVLLIVVTALFLMQAFFQLILSLSALINERRRELAFFRAMGANRGQTAKVLVLEILYLCLFGGFSGVLVSSVLLYDNKYFLQEFFQLPLVFPGLANTIIIALVAVAGTVLMGILAAIIPLKRVLLADPYQAIREGE